MLNAKILKDFTQTKIMTNILKLKLAKFIESLQFSRY